MIKDHQNNQSILGEFHSMPNAMKLAIAIVSSRPSEFENKCVYIYMGVQANSFLGFLEQASNRNQKHSDRKHYAIPKRDVANESLADWQAGLLAREKVLKFGAGLVSRNRSFHY